MPTPTAQEIADLVQQADDAASQAAGRMTDAEALAAKDAAIADMTTARDAALQGKAASDNKLADARSKVQAAQQALQALAVALG